MTWQSLETKKEALNIECLIKNVRFIVGRLMLESITAVLKPATESLQGKQVDLGSCMTTITLMKQQLQEINGDYWHNFLFPEIMKLERSWTLILQNHARLVGATSQSQSVSIMVRYGRPQPKVWPKPAARHLTVASYPWICACGSCHWWRSCQGSTDKVPVAVSLNFADGVGTRNRHKWADIDDKPKTVISALNNTESFPNIRNFLLLFVTLPITSCEPERVFSKVQRTKTAIRSTMGTERLEALVIIPAHRSTLPLHQYIINTFCVKPRRLYFGDS